MPAIVQPNHRPWKAAAVCVSLWLFSSIAPAKDWPQWGGTDARNMVSGEKGLPESFVPGEKD
jgi:hypothetical protein